MNVLVVFNNQVIFVCDPVQCKLRLKKHNENVSELSFNGRLKNHRKNLLQKNGFQRVKFIGKTFELNFSLKKYRHFSHQPSYREGFDLFAKFQ